MALMRPSLVLRGLLLVEVQTQDNAQMWSKSCTALNLTNSFSVCLESPLFSNIATEPHGSRYQAACTVLVYWLVLYYEAASRCLCIFRNLYD